MADTVLVLVLVVLVVVLLLLLAALTTWTLVTRRRLARSKVATQVLPPLTTKEIKETRVAMETPAKEPAPRHVQSVAKMERVENVMMVEEGLYPSCVTSTPHIHSYTSSSSSSSSSDSSSSSSNSSSNSSSSTIRNCSSSKSQDTKSIPAVSSSWGSTFTVNMDKAEEVSTGGIDNNTFIVPNFERRLEEVLEGDTISIIEGDEDDVNEVTVMLDNTEEENNDNNNNNNENSCRKNSYNHEKYLMHNSISDSMVNITFG